MTLSAVLLAGGESRRMGSDKATRIFCSEPLWQRQLRLLRQLEPKEIFLSARMDQLWRPADIDLLLDEAPSRGPISGIAAALAQMETSHLFVLAVDMPFVTADDLLSLVSLTRADRGVVPVTSKGPEPLAAIFLKDSSQHFTAALSSADTSLQPILRRLADTGEVELVQIPEAETQRYRSVNTPEDLVPRPACR